MALQGFGASRVQPLVDQPLVGQRVAGQLEEAAPKSVEEGEVWEVWKGSLPRPAFTDSKPPLYPFPS